MKELGARGFAYDAAAADLALLGNAHEQAVLTSVSKYPETVEHAALNRAPHALVHYLRELANTLHTYYNAEKWIVDEAPLRNARITLVLAVQQVIRNGLGILGVSAPESM
jgi:arginyl-tRNA synthetase